MKRIHILFFVALYFFTILLVTSEGNWTTPTEREIFAWVGDYMGKDINRYTVPPTNEVSHAKLVKQFSYINREHFKDLQDRLGKEVARNVISNNLKGLLAFYNPQTNKIWIALELIHGKIIIDKEVIDYRKILAHEFVHYFQIKDTLFIGKISQGARWTMEVEAYKIGEKWKEWNTTQQEEAHGDK